MRFFAGQGIYLGRGERDNSGPSSLPVLLAPIRGPEMTPTQEWLTEQVDNLVKSRFYGKVVLQFEAGVIQRLVKEESIEPPGKPPKGKDYRQIVK